MYRNVCMLCFVWVGWCHLTTPSIACVIEFSAIEDKICVENKWTDTDVC
jgi:hypothetical protein